MRYQTLYEWAIETEDDHGDISDVSHADSYRDALEMLRKMSATSIALTRRDYDEFGDFDEYGYAYVVGGALPSTFDCGRKIPRRFIKEVLLSR